MPLLLVVASLLLASPSGGEVIIVDWAGGGDFATIQDGIDSASQGDTVVVRPGTYTGEPNRDLDPGGTDMTIRSECGPDSTIIDCEGLSRAFYVHSGETLSTLISGFTVVNGYAGPDTLPPHPYGCGGAVWLHASSARFSDMVFSRNATETGASNRNGGAIYVYGGVRELWLSGCTFDSNSAYNGGAIYSQYAAVHVEDCIFDSNTCENWGGAFGTYDGTLTCTGSIFADNEGPIGGALNLRTDLTCYVSDCDFTSNRSFDWGGAISCYASRASVTDCLFKENAAGSTGAAAGFSWGAGATLSGCTFIGNSCENPGSTLSAYKASPIIDHCTFVFSRPGVDGGVIRAGLEASPEITNSVIAFSQEGTAVYCDHETGAPQTTSSCVYGNAGGDSLCGISSQILFSDPELCDTAGGSYYIESCSPCVGAASDGGDIGAWGVGCPCGDETGVPALPGGLVALGATPNPAAGSARVRYRGARRGRAVSLTVFTLAGRRVARIRGVDSFCDAGSVEWDGRHNDGELAPSGVYFYELSDGDSVARGRLTLLR